MILYSKMASGALDDSKLVFDSNVNTTNSVNDEISAISRVTMDNYNSVNYDQSKCFLTETNCNVIRLNDLVTEWVKISPVGSQIYL